VIKLKLVTGVTGDGLFMSAVPGDRGSREGGQVKGFEFRKNEGKVNDNEKTRISEFYFDMVHFLFKLSKFG